MSSSIWRGLAVAVAVVLAAGTASAREWKVYETKKYGYTLKIPAEFQLQTEDNTTTWIYQPGSAAPAAEAPKEAKPKKKKFGINIGDVNINLGEDEDEETAAPAPAGGGLQPALTIYVNWVWMPDVSSSTMFATNLKSDQQNIDSPDPDYKDIVVFDKNKGYAYDDNTYWYKEVDKSKGDEIHRWHIKSYGNKSAYTIGLTGTYEQFKEWGPVYEEVIKSFALIPLEKK